MVQQQRNELAGEFERLRKERGLSVNQVSLYAEVDRNTLARLEKAGVAPRLEILEKLARYLGADVNRWRQLAGHDPIFDADRAFLKGLRGMAEQGYRVIVDSEEVPLSWATPADVEAAIGRVRTRAGCTCAAEGAGGARGSPGGG